MESLHEHLRNKEHEACWAMFGKILHAITVIADVTKPSTQNGSYDQDIYESCQEILALESARECLQEWKILWTIAYHADQLIRPLKGFPYDPKEEREALLQYLQEWDALSHHFPCSARESAS